MIRSRRTGPSLYSEHAGTQFNPGNTVLGPEIIDGDRRRLRRWFLRRRLGIEASIIKTKVNNAIVPVLFPPWQGFTNTQSQNIGGIANGGWEAASTCSRSSAGLQWHNDFRADGNKNKVTTSTATSSAATRPFVSATPFRASGCSGRCRTTRRRRHGSGAIRRSSRGRRFRHSTSRISPSLRFKSFQFVALMTMERGAILSNSDRPYRFRQHTGDEFLSLLGPNGANTAASDSVIKYWALFDDPEKRDNVRLRQLSLTYDLPVAMSSRLGLRQYELHRRRAERQDLGGLPLPGSRFRDVHRVRFRAGRSAFLADPAPHQIPVHRPLTLLTHATPIIGTIHMHDMMIRTPRRSSARALRGVSLGLVAAALLAGTACRRRPQGAGSTELRELERSTIRFSGRRSPMARRAT